MNKEFDRRVKIIVYGSLTVGAVMGSLLGFLVARAVYLL